MNKKSGLKVLFQNPLAVVMEGIRARQQEYFRKKTISIYNIEQLKTIDLLDLFPNLNESIETYSFLAGTSLVSDLILLKSLARSFDNCAYLEIGSWRGESLVNICDVTKDCTSLTLSKAEMKALNLSEEFINVHGYFSDSIETITKIEHNSRTYDFNQLNKTFDLIFVDGDHSYEGVLSDSQKIFPLRKNERSIIVWHDYGFDPENVRYSTLKAILDGIPKNKHKNLYHISNTMCAVYIENINIPTTQTRFPSYPNKRFSLKVIAEKLKTEPNTVY
jgi:predicted O-methyltransferase YrrM